MQYTAKTVLRKDNADRRRIRKYTHVFAFLHPAFFRMIRTARKNRLFRVLFFKS